MRIASLEKSKIPYNHEHTNYINSAGIYVPSVTTVLKVINKEALIHWANSLGWRRKRVTDVLDSTSRIGTYAHKYCQMLLENAPTHEMEIFDDEIRKLHSDDEYDAIANSIQSFYVWYKENKSKLKVIHTELEMSGDTFGGTTDLVCELDRKLLIIDYKTSSDFYFTMFLQLSAYHKLYKKLYNKNADDVAVLLLDKKNGTCARLLKMSDIPYGNIKYYYRVFETANILYRHLHVLEQDWKELKKSNRTRE